jgi:hypothetical protein
MDIIKRCPPVPHKNNSETFRARKEDTAVRRSIGRAVEQDLYTHRTLLPCIQLTRNPSRLTDKNHLITIRVVGPAVISAIIPELRQRITGR